MPVNNHRRIDTYFVPIENKSSCVIINELKQLANTNDLDEKLEDAFF